MDLSKVRVRKGDDLSFHFEALLERDQVSDENHGRTPQTSIGEGSSLYILFKLICVASAVHKNILDASIGEEFESILDQWGICKRKETLRG